MEVGVKSGKSPSSSPEFEFWVVKNPAFPPPDLLPADELFLNGVLLPLHLLPLPPPTRPPPKTDPSPPPSASSILHSPSAPSLSRRWKDLFFKAGTEKKEKNSRKKDLDGVWPFTRSQSAAGRSGSAGPSPGRKTSSAPCSRSNSRGDPAGPPALNRRARSGAKDRSRMWSQAPGGGGHPRVLNLNVNNCIGYGERVSSMGEDGDGVLGGDRAAEGSVSSGGGFSLRAIFSKKI